MEARSVMLRSAFIGWASIGIFAFLLVGCSGRYEWHQKLTVEVETPSGTKTGSSVVKISWSGHDSFTDSYHGSYRGEATMVDLGGGRYLFALIGEETKFLGLRTFNGGYGISEDIFATMTRKRGVRSVTPEDYPLFVTFDDIGDPLSIKEVDPDNLSAMFGPGYAMKSVTLELTDEPVTKGVVENVLRWLSEMKGGMLDGRRTSTIKAENRLANDLSQLNLVYE